MNSYRETILEAVKAVAIASQAVPVGNVYRSRFTPFSIEELPAVMIRPMAESIDNSNRSVNHRKFQVRIEAHGRGNPSDKVADAILAPISNALGSDPTLAGLVRWSVETEILEAEFPSGDGIQVLIPMIWTFSYSTRNEDCTIST